MSSVPPFDPYAVLGVSRSATAVEITHAYRARLRAYHPDTRQPDPSPDSSADHDSALRRTLAAYAVLRDPHRRATYDQHHPSPRHATTRTPVAHPARQSPIQAGPVYWRPS